LHRPPFGVLTARARGAEDVRGLGHAARVSLSIYASSTGYGPKYRGARGQPRTRGPEADETKTMTVTLPHRV